MGRPSLITVIGLAVLAAPALGADDAAVVSDTIPAVMAPGEIRTVSITMRNTGTTTWLRDDGYVLGRFGDAAQFVSSDIAIVGATPYPPNATYTFTFEITAPATEGTRNTSWRMKHGSTPFGAQLDRQIQVTWGPAPPSAPTITFPSPGVNFGSNQLDIRWIGDPHDSYEIHLGSQNVPQSNDGWDSGQVFVQHPASEAKSGYLAPDHTYYLWIRLHNPNGWGPWSSAGRWFHTVGEFPGNSEPHQVTSPPELHFPHSICMKPDGSEFLVASMEGYQWIRWHRLNANGIKIASGTIPHSMAGLHNCGLAYNSNRNEYLVAMMGWQETPNVHNEIFVQRLDSNGSPVGTQWFVRSAPMIGIPTVAYSPVSNVYLLTWADITTGTWEVYCQRLNGDTAQPIGSIVNLTASETDPCGSPEVTYNADLDEFFVLFQPNIYVTSPTRCYDLACQRINPSTGLPILPQNVYLANSLDCDQNGEVAYDEQLHRYLLVYQSFHGSPNVWSILGQFVSADGRLIRPDGTPLPGPDPFVILDRASTGLIGWDAHVAWDPTTGEYVVSWCDQDSNLNWARRVSQNGKLLSEPFRIVSDVTYLGNWSPFVNYSRASGEFIFCWYNAYTSIYTRRYRTTPIPPPDTTPPGPVTGLNATPGDGLVTLTWTNPADPDFAGTMIRYKLGGYPTGPTDGTLLADRNNVPGSTDSFTHTGLSGGTTYHYALFTYDEVPNYSTAATKTAVPSGDRVIAAYAFNSSADGWSTAVWKAGPYDPGTIGWDAAAGRTGGGMRAAGSGLTDNSTRETREGAEMWRTIPTTGFDRIRVLYDLRVNSLGSAWFGYGTGDPNAHPDHEDVQEQLTVFYRTSTTGEWIELGPWLGRDVLLGYQTYGTRSIDLAGVPGVDSAPGFGLKFRWQFNTSTDLGDLDNITVRGCRMETINPTIGITNPTSDNKCPANVSPFAIGGWASDNVGVVQVTWQNNRGGTGICSGTNWWDASVPLFSGQNSITVAARDAAGNIGTDSIVITYVPDPPVSVGDAKSAPDNANVYLASKTVGAIFSDCIYVEEQDRTSGIKVKPLVMPAGLAVGTKIDFAGQVKTEPTGERYLTGPILIVN